MKYLIRVGIAVLLVATLFVGERRLNNDSENDQTDVALPNFSLPLDPESAVDSAWFCPSGTRSEDGVADQSVQIANISVEESATAVATVLTEEGRGASRELQLEPGESTTIDAAELDPPSEDDLDDLAGMVVRITRGNAVVSHSNTTGSGVAYGACGTQASEVWHFGSGRNTGDGSNIITLMNPFDEDVSIDIIPHRGNSSSEFEGLTLFGNSVFQIDFSQETGFAEIDQIPITIQSRGGRIIAERLQIVDEDLAALLDGLEDDLAGDAEESDEAVDEDADEEAADEDAEDNDIAVTGASLQLGVRAPQNEWIFTSGRVNENSTHLVTVFNPRDPGLQLSPGRDFVENIASLSPEGIADSLLDELDLDFGPSLSDDFFQGLDFESVEAEVEDDADEEEIEEATRIAAAQLVVDAVLDEVNPQILTRRSSRVQIEIWPTNTGLRESIFVPIERDVTPLGVSVVDLVAESRRLGFVLPVDFTVEVVSLNDLPVLSERWQFAERVTNSQEIDVGDLLAEPEPEVGDAFEALPADVDDTSPNSASAGLMTSGGIDFGPLESWVVPWTPVFSDSSSWITVFAPTNGTQITVRSGVDGEPIEPANGADIANPYITAVDGERWFFPIPDDGSGGGSLVVNASRPVTIEAQAISAEGSDILPAIPLIDS